MTKQLVTNRSRAEFFVAHADRALHQEMLMTVGEDRERAAAMTAELLADAEETAGKYLDATGTTDLAAMTVDEWRGFIKVVAARVLAKQTDMARSDLNLDIPF